MRLLARCYVIGAPCRLTTKWGDGPRLKRKERVSQAACQDSSSSSSAQAALRSLLSCSRADHKQLPSASHACPARRHSTDQPPGAGV
jgi:hypothetical protein